MALKRLITRYEDAPLRGMPDRAIGISNSERMLAACPRKYLFGAIEGMRPEETPKPLTFGSAWHTLMEAIWSHWRDHDSTCPTDRVAKTLAELHKEMWDKVSDDPQREYSRLYRLWEGYNHTYGLDPDPRFQVIAVELPVCAPIINPDTGNVYRPRMTIAQGEDGSWFIPSPMNQGTNHRIVQWPWYQVGRLDAVIQHRETGAIWAFDHKTAASPDTFLRGMTVDPQMPGYLWMLKWQIENGYFHPPLHRVGDEPNLKGFMFGVAKSGLHPDPTLLKSGELSKSKSRKVPSWRYIEAVRSHRLDPKDYADHIAELAGEVDPMLYRRDWMTAGPDVLKRYEAEIFGEARRLASLRRRGTQPSDWSEAGATERAMNFPRVPICRLPGGYCSFRGPCTEDGPDSRSPFKITPSIRWVDSTTDAEESANATGETNASLDW